MEIKKVNIFKFLLIRNFFSIFICFLTVFVTNRIADMDFLLGFNTWQATSRTNDVAISVFSRLGFLENRYLIIAIVIIICSIILYFLVKNHIDEKNKYLWQLFLMSPGLLIYSNSPTKETLFLYPAIIFVILVCNFLTNKTQLFSFNTLINISLLYLLFNIRGDLVFPYVFLLFISLFVKSIYIGGISNQLNFNKSIINSFIISISLLFIVSNLNPNYFERILGYLSESLVNQGQEFFRPTVDFSYVKNPLNFFQMQYLALFPTPIELLNKPYKIIIIFDSLLLVYIFKNSWERLFKTIRLSKTAKKIILILFTYVSIVYFVVFAIIGTFNLGLSQRIRINYVPLGIILPLVLEKKLREKQKIKFSQK